MARPDQYVFPPPEARDSANVLPPSAKRMLSGKSAIVTGSTGGIGLGVARVAAKHGIAGLTKTAALEVAEHRITVNAVCPGYVMTPLVEKQIPEQAKARGITEQQVISDVLLAAQPTKRFVTVEELSALVNFLCTDNARSITGATLPVDGGWTAH